MAPQHERTPELRRFLVINVRIGSRESGYLVGPALVSTRDYKWFHLWDEPSAAVLGEDDYEVVKIYRLDLTYDQVMRQFAQDFPSITTGPISRPPTSCNGRSVNSSTTSPITATEYTRRCAAIRSLGICTDGTMPRLIRCLTAS